jgi:putative membrane-bound dehydrogenase-like protein
VPAVLAPRFLALTLLLPVLTFAEEAPRSTDPRFQISLYAEQPLIATPTGLNVDARGRVWAIECNTHFRPANYSRNPTDRILIFDDRDHDGRAEEPRVFTDGFTATMSVAVRPDWLPPVVLAKGDTLPAKAQQVYVATRNTVMLLEDLDGDDVCDRQTKLFELETKGDYPHNGFAGLTFDALGHMYVGMGENLGEPYKVHDQSGAVVFESGEGGNVYRFRPDGTEFRLWARGFWNPHASCFNAFGRMFTVDNDPDSRPPCRLLHVVEDGYYGYRYAIGRKGLHPFTSWNGEIFGNLPMVAGTGEAPSGVIACEHEAFPEELRGDLLATSWGDHRIDRFHLTPRGASFESIAEPLIVGGANFRPVGIAQAPDGSLFCTDWVKPDYELHGQGRIWKISRTGDAPKTPTVEIATADTQQLSELVSSPTLSTRRVAARKLAESDGGQLLAIVRDKGRSERARYEALAALILNHLPDHVRVLKSTIPATEPPFDSVQTLMAAHFDERPSITRVLDLFREPQGSDPGYLLEGLKSAAPILRSLGGSRSDKSIEVANRCVEVTDAFGRLEIVHLLAKALDGKQLEDLIQADAALSAELRTCAVLAARERDVNRSSAAIAGLNRPEPLVRRAAAQWAAEQHLTEARDAVAASLTRSPMTTDLFLATVAALEMLDGKNPQDFDKTPSGKYVLPLVQDEKTPPEVLAVALRIADPADPAMTPEILGQLIHRDDPRIHREAVRTLAASPSPEAVDPLLSLADEPDDKADALLGLSRWLNGSPADPTVRDYFLNHEPWSIDMLRAARGAAAIDPDIRNAIVKRVPSILEQSPIDTRELVEQLVLTLGADNLPDNVRSRLKPRPSSLDEWRTALSQPMNADDRPENGRIVFFHPQGVGCSKCHTIEGRGGKVGPDLSHIGRAFSREKLIDSILEPSREISPQFTNWQMATEDGRVFTGMIVHENEGVTILGDTNGNLTKLPTIEIVERRPQRVSVMPEKLADRMTLQDFRDLLAYLQSIGR